MSTAVELDRKVIFALNATVSQRLLARVQKFIVDAETGNVTLNIKDGVIRGAHLEIILSQKGPPPVRRRTA